MIGRQALSVVGKSRSVPFQPSEDVVNVPAVARAHHASCSWARSRRALSLPGRARNHVRYSGVVNTFHMMFEHIWRGCPAAVDVRASPKWLAASLRPQGQQFSSAIRAAKRTDQAPPSSGMRGLTNAKVRALELLGRGMDSARIRKGLLQVCDDQPERDRRFPRSEG